MDSYYIGIDGGGTNSRMLVVDGAGDTVGLYNGGATNMASNPAQAVKDNIQALLDGFLDEKGATMDACRGLCIGSAGVDTQENARDMESIIKACGLGSPLRVINDGELILWAELEDRPGVALISGTGSVSYGKNRNGDVQRVGGWGHLFDDYGSAYWIGKEGLSRAFLSFDGRGDKSLLEARMAEHFGVDSLDLSIPAIYPSHSDKAVMAGLAVVVQRAADAGDETARQILYQAADDIFRCIETLIDDLDMEGQKPLIAASGGNIENNPMMRQRLLQRLGSRYDGNVEFTLARQQPVYGAAYLARSNGN